VHPAPPVLRHRRRTTRLAGSRPRPAARCQIKAGMPRGLSRRQLPALLSASPDSGPTGAFPVLDPGVPSAGMPDSSGPDSVAANCCVGHICVGHAAGRLTRRVLFPPTALSRFPAGRRRHA
jgi:hypothetical protein